MQNEEGMGDPVFAERKRAGLSVPLTLGRQMRIGMQEGALIGTFLIELAAPTTVTIIAQAGFDFVVLDLEHSAFGFERLEAMIAAAHAVRLPVIVRPWDNSPGLIGKILDLGANGIMAPHISCAEEARQIVQACRYGGAGGRGLSPICRFASLADQVADLNQSVFTIVQIEGVDGLAAAPEIASIEGLDALFFGPYDLALALGLSPGEQRVFGAIDEAIARCGSDVRFGIYIDTIADSNEWAAKNVTLQCLSFDGRMLLDGAKSVLAGRSPSNAA